MDMLPASYLSPALAMLPQPNYATRVCAWCWERNNPGVPVPTLSSGLCEPCRVMLVAAHRARKQQQREEAAA